MNTKNVDKTVMSIYETFNYNQFKVLQTNRELKSVNLNRLRASFKAHPGIIIPIWVNPLMEIIDGQHRLIISQELNLPIYYFIREGGIIEARIMNTYTAKWNDIDYHESHVKEGNPTYIHLDQLYKDYENIPRGIVKIVATGFARGEKQGSPDKTGFRLSSRKNILGKMELRDEAEIRPVLSKLREYKNYVKASGRFYKSMVKALNNASFDHDYFIEKLKAAHISPDSYRGIINKDDKTGDLLFPDNRKNVEEAISKIYNKNKTNKITLF